MHDKKLTTETNAPPSRAISMAVTMRRCDAKRITRCSMFRATLEATGHHHWASICPILFCWMPWSSIFGLKNQNRNNSIHRTYDTIISKMALNLLGFGRVFYGSCCLRDTRPAFLQEPWGKLQNLSLRTQTNHCKSANGTKNLQKSTKLRKPVAHQFRAQ